MDDEEYISITRSYSISQIFGELIEVINDESELPEGDLAGPRPCPERLAAAIVSKLADFRVFQGSHFKIVEHARRILGDEIL